MAETHFPECKLIDAAGYMDFTWQMYFREEQAALAGTGTVTGPVVSVAGNVALFGGIDGIALIDGGTLGTAAFTPVGNYDVAGAALAAQAASDPLGSAATAQAAAIAASQPLDPDLSAIALLTTTAFGRALLTLADAAATRIVLGFPAASASGGAAPAGGIGTAAGAWSTAADRDAAIALLNNMRAALIANGLMT
jgi:hypothetical protein